VLASACDAEPVASGPVTVVPAALAELEARVGRMVPGLVGVRFPRGRACLRTFARDSRPTLGWDPGAGHVFWVAGLGGHGATSALAIGEMAARQIIERLG
jgi:glycine/D-amino acid oxidase-like deaminating enzyme